MLQLLGGGGQSQLGVAIRATYNSAAPDALRADVMSMMRDSLKCSIRAEGTFAGAGRRTVQTVLQESGISAVFSESTSSTSNHQVLTALRAVHRQAILKVIKDADVSTLFVGASWYAVKQFGSCGWACFNIAHREGRDTFCIRMKLAADMGRRHRHS